MTNIDPNTLNDRISFADRQAAYYARLADRYTETALSASYQACANQWRALANQLRREKHTSGAQPASQEA